MEIKYSVKTNKSFEEAVESIKNRLMEKNFGVLWELNLKDKLKEKGFEITPNFKILEVCNPMEAKEVLDKNIEVGYFLPCKLAVYEKEEAVYIGMLKPVELMKLVRQEDLMDIAERVEKVLKEAIHQAV